MRSHRSLFVLLALGLVLASCGDDVADTAASDDAAEPTAATVTVADAAEGSDGDRGAGSLDVATGGAELAAVTAQVPADRKIIFTGRIDLVVDDVEAAIADVVDAARVEGGFVFAQHADLAADRRSASLTIKIPVVRYDAAFDAMGAVGTLRSASKEAEDVTAEFVDLDSRQATLAASIDRLRGFLAQTNSVEEVSRLESELTRRESERDAIAAQLRVLRDRTTYGTVVVSLTEQSTEEIAALVAAGADDRNAFAAGLDAGWDVAVAAGRSVAAVAGFLVPVAPIPLLILTAAYWLGRRRRRWTPAPADPAV